MDTKFHNGWRCSYKKKDVNKHDRRQRHLMRLREQQPAAAASLPDPLRHKSLADRVASARKTAASKAARQKETLSFLRAHRK